jgi:hypothetical protein
VSKPDISASEPAKSFAKLSAALTGFREVDLWGTGQVQVYVNELLAIVGDDIVGRLLLASDQALGSKHPKKALKEQVLDDQDLGPVARNLITLWYLGQWAVLPQAWRNKHGASPLDSARVISADAYLSGLVWTAIGAHPMGGKPTGYGSWAQKPAVPAIPEDR